MNKKALAATLLLPLALLISACGGNAASPTAPTVSPAAEATASSPTKATSDRGNLIKNLGQGASLTDQDGTETVAFVVKKITVDPKCTEQYAQKPKNGHFVALDVSVKTTSALAKTPGGNFTMNSAQWKVIAPNGTTFNGYLSGNAYGCIASDKEIAQTIGPAENVTGTLLLDVPSVSGTLIFKPFLADAGWEWNYKK
jgi:hypothetical protein